MALIRPYGKGRHWTRRADVLARATTNAPVSIHNGDIAAVRPLDAPDRIYWTMAEAGRAIDALSRSKATILVPHGVAYADTLFIDSGKRSYCTGRADLGAPSAVYRTVALLECHLGLHPVLGALRRPQHMIGTRLYAKLTANATHRKVGKRP